MTCAVLTKSKQEMGGGGGCHSIAVCVCVRACVRAYCMSVCKALALTSGRAALVSHAAMYTPLIQHLQAFCSPDPALAPSLSSISLPLSLSLLLPTCYPCSSAPPSSSSSSSSPVLCCSPARSPVSLLTLNLSLLFPSSFPQCRLQCLLSFIVFSFK